MSGTAVDRLGYFWFICGILGVFSGVTASPRGRPLAGYGGGGGGGAMNEAVERLSQVFGIKRIPPDFRHKTPPEYMTNLFKSVAYEDGITKSATPYDADVVRGFPDKARREQMHFKFNISYVEAHEDILEAEFQLFKLRPRTISSHLRGVHVVQLKLYQILDHSSLKLIDQRRISAHKHGWEKFRVTQTVQGWLKNQTANYGFLVEATSLRGEYVNGSHVQFAQRQQHHDSKQPVLVVFTQEQLIQQQQDPFSDEDDLYDDLGAAELEARRQNYIQFLNEGHRAQYGSAALGKHLYMSPRQHQILTEASTARTRYRRDAGYYKDKEDGNNNNGGGGGGYKYNRKRKKSCSRDNMYVDFEEIGWSGWIISPKGYNAYHCKGDCPFPLGQNQKPTNHATVQSIVHAMRIPVNKDVGTPCCVPNKLFSISLLYFDDEENVTLKKYADMVAASCGCH